MGQHDQHEHRPADTGEPLRRYGIDHDALYADVLPILERHGVVPPGERLDGWVWAVRFTGHDDGVEYTRSDLILSPGFTLGEARTLMVKGGCLLG